MAQTILTQEIINFLRSRIFIDVGTCDFEARPNVAPKYLLKIKGDYIYLVDYVIGRTFQNIKINPRISLSTVNLDTLIGYQINGFVELIEDGNEYEQLLSEYRNKQIQASVDRIIEGVHHEKRYKNFETTFPDKVVMFKIKVEEVIEIVPTGELKRKSS